MKMLALLFAMRLLLAGFEATRQLNPFYANPAVVEPSVPSCDVDTSTPAPRTAAEMVAAGYKRYGIEKGILYFRLDGAVKGTETIYFDHWGWREAKYINTETNLGTFREKTNKVSFLDGERRYEYDPANNTAHWFDSPQVEAAAKRYGTKNMVVVGDEMIKNMGGEKVRTETFAGVECDVWEIKRYRTTLWMWQGLTLKERSAMDDIPVGRTCLIIDRDKPIPEEKISLPKGAVLVKG